MDLQCEQYSFHESVVNQFRIIYIHAHVPKTFSFTPCHEICSGRAPRIKINSSPSAISTEKNSSVIMSRLRSRSVNQVNSATPSGCEVNRNENNDQTLSMPGVSF